MGQVRGFLVILATSSLLGGCFSSFCPSEYRPYTCTSCVEFTKTSRQFSEACATQSASRVRIETAAQNETIRRYMEVYNVSLFWTGYSIANNEVVVADTDTVVQIEYSGDCSEDCCLAWRLEPYGAVALECTKELPAFCSTDRDFSQLDDSGSGAGEFITVGEMSGSDEQSVMYGADVSLTCSRAPGDDVKWYINSEKQDKGVSDTDNESKLELMFSTPGIYQCEVTGSVGIADIRTVSLCGVDGIPGDVEILTATAQSQTELVVNWRPPLLLGTSDPLQLRYSIYYTTDNVLDVNTAQVETDVIPQLQNEYEKKLSGLQKGQKYALGIVATSTFTTTPISSNPSFNVIVSTYGEVPSASVSGLKVQRLKDNDKILVVSWEAASLTPPVGPVALYEVQYRDAQQAVSNKAHVRPPSSSLVLRDVANANDYEVRVAILVEVYREPIQRNRSSWTQWVRVNGTTSVVPTEPVGPSSSTDTDADVIVAAVLIPIAVILIVVLLLLAAVFWGCRAGRENGYTISVSEKGVVPEEDTEKRNDLLVTSTDV